MKNQYIITLLLALLIITVSCEKVTDQVNPSGITPESFYKNASDADAAIISAYDAFQNPERYVLWGDARSDLLVQSDRSGINELQLAKGDVNSSNPYAAWDNMYNAIKRANSVLKNVPLINDASLDIGNKRARIMGEAYFLRALAYFYLVRTFDNVPLILEPYESLNQDLYPKQAAPAEVYAQIEKDLIAASPRLADLPYGTNVQQNKGRATKGAVRSALTDLYLWNKNYQKAADTALAVINSPANYTLVSGANYGNMFNTATENSSESIFEIQITYANNFEGLGARGQNTNGLVNMFLPLAANGFAGGDYVIRPSDKLMNAFSGNDLRRAATFGNTGPIPNTPPFRDANLPYVSKYMGTVTTSGGAIVRYTDANQIIYRLADVILMRAEALNELGGTGTFTAITLLNSIRSRAGLLPTTALDQSEVRLAIENERFLELAFEGKRYFDLKRTGRYAAVTGNPNANWLRWPIINTELPPLNPNIIQNPGY
ncbi:MAG: RagB/SusD family nutrient uptake outer membrane protein [Pyrinomonadaceae bacterium]|nr:RagB/SusD family nutrient uptake outer membrane protein [Sphingobacteriaceae bacterium]